MQCKHVKGHSVSRLKLPAENTIFFRIFIDIWSIRKASFRKPLCLFFEESPWQIPVPLMRSGYEFKCPFKRYWINRNPKTDILHSFNIVVRLILMPWGPLFRSCFFNQHMVVKQTNLLRTHKFCSNF